jgi:Lar family restriction alleviation protein
MQGNLKPCPFCGGEAAIDTLNTIKGNPGAYRMQCQGCGVATRWCSSEISAQSAWSIRVPTAVLKAKKRYKPWQKLVYLSWLFLVSLKHPDPKEGKDVQSEYRVL